MLRKELDRCPFVEVDDQIGRGDRIPHLAQERDHLPAVVGRVVDHVGHRVPEGMGVRLAAGVGPGQRSRELLVGQTGEEGLCCEAVSSQPVIQVIRSGKS